MATVPRMFRILTAAAVFALLPGASTARAQDAPFPRFEIGGASNGMIPIAAEGARILISGGPVVSVSLSRRVRVDLGAEAAGPVASSGLWGLYQAQTRFQLRTSADGLQALYLTAGAAGFYSHRRFKEYRQTRADGSIVVTPGFREWRLNTPRIASVGIAHQRVINPRIALMLSAQTMIGEGAIVLRGGAGLSFGLGAYR